MSKTVLITGGSAGIGAACARLAARDGWDVAIGYRSDKAGAEEVKKDVESLGRKAVLLQGDVSDPSDVSRIFDAFDAAFDGLGALVNNAGIAPRAARVDEMSPERVAQMMAINVTGAFMVAGQAVRRMSTAKGGNGGVIVNMSSAAARLGSPGQYVDYAASKGAIDVMTKGLAEEVAAEGIRVAAIRPGLIETDIHRKMGDADRLRRLAPAVPMKRTGTAEEVAEVVVWLMSDAASYVTSTVIDVAGGR